MCDFKNYIATKLELELNKTRLELLEEQKESIFNKYFPTTAKIKQVVISKTNKENDAYIGYMHEINKKNNTTGLNITEEIIFLNDNIKRLERHLKKMDDILNRAEGLEYELFYMIICKGVRVTPTIQHLAEKYNYDERTMWRTYDKKIKKYVIKLKKSQ